jgi:hypothetical protein
MVLGILRMMLSSVAPWTTIAPTQLPASSRLASLRLPPNALFLVAWMLCHGHAEVGHAACALRDQPCRPFPPL